MISYRFLKKIYLVLIFSAIVIFMIYRTVILNIELRSNMVRLDQIVKKNPTIFCMILTTPKSFEKLRAQAALSVWAHKCDNFKFISLTTEEVKKAQNQSGLKDINYFIMHPKELVEDKYGKLTQKVFVSFKQIYTDFSNYDWYLKADDDTFIEMYNLRKFIADKDPKKPVTYGFDFKVIVEKGYHSGGAGYLMSKEAFSRLGWILHAKPDICVKSGVEDVDVAKCLRKLNVFPEKSIDELGRERFIPLNLPGFYMGSIPTWLKKYSANEIRNGTECCSDSFISVHYMTPKKMFILGTVIARLTYLLNQNNKNETLIRPTFKDIIDSFIKYEKIENEMVKYWAKISKAMTTKKIIPKKSKKLQKKKGSKVKENT